MSHPKDRRERFLAGKHKALRRCSWYWRNLWRERRYYHNSPEKLCLAPRLYETLQDPVKMRDYFYRFAAGYRDTTKKCSCSWCCSPRHAYGDESPTIQELRFNAMADEEEFE